MEPVPETKDVFIREYAPREVIVKEGAPNDRFFVILSGTVEIQQNRKNIRILSDGDVFGIENYYLNRSYTTSGIAMSRSRIAAYHTDMIKEILFTRPQLTSQILSSTMLQLEQTTQVAEANIPLENVVDINERHYEESQIVIEEGTEGKEIFQLIKSEKGLQVSKSGKIVGKITEPGEYFGEMSAILNEKRSATVTSIGKSQVKVFNCDDLDTILDSYPELAKIIIDTLAKRLSEANKLITAQNPPLKQES